MKIVDDEEKNLTTAEKSRNRRSGLVILYMRGKAEGNELRLQTHNIDGEITRDIDDSKLNIGKGQEYSRNFGKVELGFNDN